MFCDRCGTRLSESQSFCPSCGRSVQITPPVPAASRIASHIRLLGILWLAVSALRIIPGLFLFAMFRGGAMHFLPPDAPFFLNGLLRGVGILILASGAAGILTGWGLLDRQPWARMLAIVMGCLNLIDVPFGTALGIYTFWVLLPAASEQEYRDLARAA